MNFYVLDKPKPNTPEDRLGRSDAIREEGFNTGEALRCPRCNRFLTSLRWLPPYRIELETWGREYSDVVEIEDEMIVSERFVQLFRANGLKGLSEFEPVEVLNVKHRRGKPKQVMPRYFKTTVTLSPTMVDQKSSGFVWGDESAICSVCLWNNLKRFTRIVIKEDTWNGDDIFFPRGGYGPIVSETFKILCDQHAVRGVIFSPAKNYGYECCPWERQDWDIRLFDETLANLESGNTGGRFDHFLQAMREMRDRVAADPKIQWIDNLRQRFGEGIDKVADAASKAYYKLIRNP
jgi:hypothetical protein